MDSGRYFSFAGGPAGSWSVFKIATVIGAALPIVERLEILDGHPPADIAPQWVLRGVTSNERYVTRAEKGLLVAKQAGLGRPQAKLGAVIPIRKNAAWWSMTQDERRAILEEQSHHIHTGLKYLPAIARRLHHCRDLGRDLATPEAPEPFDFITLFDYAPEHAAAFEDLVGELRATEEWKYVDREIDIRIARERGK